MFEACPETKAILDEFKSTAYEALRAHEPFINYCASLMEQFDTAITELDDADTAHAILQRIGAQYKADKMPDTFIKVIPTLTLSSELLSELTLLINQGNAPAVPQGRGADPRRPLLGPHAHDLRSARRLPDKGHARGLLHQVGHAAITSTYLLSFNLSNNTALYVCCLFCKRY
jgi:hypothetical protein